MRERWVPSVLRVPRGRWGGLRRTTPLATGWGRAPYVDRWYIDRFLASRCEDIRGDVLEVEEPRYVSLGGAHVIRTYILDLTERPGVTIVADLAVDGSLPPAAFDCVILTQTLQFVPSVETAIANVHQSLRPGGTLLLTVPTVSRIAGRTLEPGAAYGDLWRFTPAGMAALLAGPFDSGDVDVVPQGNLLSTIAFLAGVGADALRTDELDHDDPAFPLVVCAAARRSDE
jgi:SAM-dependent methyltransferase